MTKIERLNTPVDNTLTKNDIERLVDLAKRLTTQDNRSTRLPIWFLLQDIREEITDNDAEYFLYYDSDDGECYRAKTAEGILTELLDAREEESLAEFEREDLLSKIEDEMKSIKIEYETKRVFLTKKAADDHLKANYYHYSSKARIYVDHAWRDPEMELVHKLILQYLR